MTALNCRATPQTRQWVEKTCRHRRGIGGAPRAFTLTEMLVAVAILSVLFTLLFVPMTTAFDNARRGRTMAELQNAADYALEIMVRELIQAVDILPQARVHAEDHNYSYPSGWRILHRAGEPLNLLDDQDRLRWDSTANQFVDDPSDPQAMPDDDTLSRIDFVVRAVRDDRITAPPNVTAAPSYYSVLTYYVRRVDPGQPYQFMDTSQPANRRQIFRAHWQPDPTMEPQPEMVQNRWTGRWLVRDGWALEDFSLLPSSRLISHIALTPPDVDVADLRFTVEREGVPSPNRPMARPRAVVIELTLRKPTPGARATLPNTTDVPSISIRRRIKVVLPNVP